MKPSTLLFPCLVGLIMSSCCPRVESQGNRLSLDEPSEYKSIVTGGLQLGGSNRFGRSIEVNNYYMSFDGKPVIPVLGEFHFSRYDASRWEEEILKIKAGGVTVLPTYVFWSLHERREGEFDWSGNLNLRKFLELCKKHDMDVIIRIGPFCHGEIRNGSIPDWIFAKALDIRSDDAQYLKYVDRLYGQIAAQMEGLYFKDGGPVIGCQIENEMQHSAAPWGICYPGEPKDYTSALMDSEHAKIGVSVQEEQLSTAELGEKHMRTLKALAEKHGIQTPIYTATGWGNAAVIGNEAIPVTSAYTYPFWSKPKMSPFCRFKDIHAHPDYEPVRYNPTDFPSFCAEMGVGIQMTYDRRPQVRGEAAEALMVRTLGSGSNGIGYYMYHGGITPKMDSWAFFADEPMGMPKMSYDFQAPLGEGGLEGRMYRNLRLIHLFLQDFSDRLAPMQTVLPQGWEDILPEDRQSVRYCARMKDSGGFLFFVNFQDHDDARSVQKDISIDLNLNSSRLRIPSEGGFDLPKDASLILPFNLKLDSLLLRYSLCQPLCWIDDKGRSHYFFFALEGIKAEYCFEDETITVDNPGFGSTFEKGGVLITTLTREQALNTARIGGKLVISPATVIENPGGQGALLLSYDSNEAEYAVFPSENGSILHTAKVESVESGWSCERFNSRRLVFSCPDAERILKSKPQVDDLFLEMDFTSDVAMAFLSGELVLDHFWSAEKWKLALGRYGKELQKEDMVLYFRPLRQGSSFLEDLPQDKMPDFGEQKSILEIDSARLVVQYRIPIEL